MKNQILKQCSIKNVLIIICILILLYLIYDVYVVRENFQISAWDLFKDPSQLNAATGPGGAADELDNFCEKIQQLHALCTRCESDDQKFSEGNMCDWGDNWGFTENEPGKEYIYLGSNFDGFNTETSGNELINSRERYVRCGVDYESSGNRVNTNKLKCNNGIIGISGTNFTCEPKQCLVSTELSNNFVSVQGENFYNANEKIPHHWFSEGDRRLIVKCKYPKEWYDKDQYEAEYPLNKGDCTNNNYYKLIGKCKMRTLTLDTASSDFDDENIFDGSGLEKLNSDWGDAPTLNYKIYKTKLKLISELIKPTDNTENYFTDGTWKKIKTDSSHIIILDRDAIEKYGKIKFKLKQLETNNKDTEETEEKKWWNFW